MPIVIPILAIGAAYALTRPSVDPATETPVSDSPDQEPPVGETPINDAVPSGPWPEIDQYAGSVPADFLRRFVQAESGFNPCSIGKVAQGRVWEAGIAQLYFETPGQVVYGVTCDQLRAACVGLTEKQSRPLTPEERAMHAKSAAAQAADFIKSAGQRLSSRGLSWSEDDILCMAKMIHNLPILTTSFLTAAVSAGQAGTWDAYRAFIDSLSNEDAIAIYPEITTPSMGGSGANNYLPLTRYTAIAEKVGRGV